MKISWGIIIITIFTLFSAGIITMVAISMSKNTDLVSDNYYEQEIKYQKQIDLLKNSAEYRDKISASSEENEIVVNFSGIENKGNLSGEMEFYRTSDAKKDFKINISPDSQGVQKINSDLMDRGLWKIKISIVSGGNNYFVEKNIFLK
jgi:hypothetical protein